MERQEDLIRRDYEGAKTLNCTECGYRRHIYGKLFVMQAGERIYIGTFTDCLECDKSLSEFGREK